MDSTEIRKKFFAFFIAHNHTQVTSSSLLPADDPTLLFANAGMNQFKDVFLGKEKRSYKRAVTIQKCIRAGGKHNDLENVGFTQRHLTFFEMMGNFSFGDYFKKEAIRYAWDFLTQEALLPADKLHASVFRDDQESYDIWHKEIGLPENRIVRLGEQDNFWQMGDTGPCGPCTEIYIDRGLAYACGKPTCAPGCSCDRFMEIWNNVFMQFDRQADGVLLPLKQTGVDTGMGLERLCAAIQGKDSVFETDIFAPLIARIQELTHITYTTSDVATKAAFRVLADHIRSSSFAIADGALPSNEGRGYVLRKIIRRAALFAQKLSQAENIFPQLIPTLVAHMGTFYPELIEREELIFSIIKSEVDKFAHNLIQGQAILKKYFEESAQAQIITGPQAFKLYDTYGFPLELTKVMAQEAGYTIDLIGFDQEMEKQRLQSGRKIAQEHVTLDESLVTEFTGYTQNQTETKISSLIPEEDGSVWMITPQSPLYVECGGQISDTAVIIADDEVLPVLEIKKVNQAILARVQPKKLLKQGQEVTIIVDKTIRDNTRKNHTATHLLQAALMRILGKGVKQAGSLVTPDYLRFDFTYHENPTTDQITTIERLVNDKIYENIPVITTQTTYQDAVSRGVIAFFGEKYNPENVRVVEIPGFSAELCGGTHVQRTGDIGVFKITEITSLSAGNRRIVALTGPKALELFQEVYHDAKQLAQDFKVKVDQLPDAINKHKEQLKVLQGQLKELKKDILYFKVPVWLNEMQDIHGLPFLYLSLSEEPSALRAIIDELLKKKQGLYMLVNNYQGKNTYILQVSPAFASRIDFKSLLEWLKNQGFTGGASTTGIQGGVQTIDPLFDQALKQWLKNHI